tara:strand:- start:154 stop:456 length:303 start_codon:yes stop_codon:yes gene_type:complete
MNREIDTNDFQKEINQVVGHVAKKITKMVIHYNDESTIILEDGRVGRTGNWDTHCSICGEKSDSSVCSPECEEEAHEILSQIREEEYKNELLYDKMRDNL